MGNLNVSAPERMFSFIKRVITYLEKAANLVSPLINIFLFPRYGGAPLHKLGSPVIVSLTSYPPRYRFLSRTLKSLIDQSVKPDRIILWIADNDYHALPPGVFALKHYGLEIRTCVDLRSYKKILPTLESFPDAFVVTADDDVYYSADWLKTILSGFDPQAPSVVCRRAHRPTTNSLGHVAPYSDWDSEVEMAVDAPPANDLFPTGIAGVMYYPNCLPAETLNRAVIEECCPSADDVWLYWMGQLAGLSYRQVGGPFRQICWPGTQRVSLQNENVQNKRNDSQLQSLQLRYPKLS